MAGQLCLCLENRNIARFLLVMPAARSWCQRLTVCLIMLTVPLAAGSFEIRYKAGTRPEIGALERSLEIGKSTRADVLAVLGKPNGEGATMLPIDDKARKMWSYYYEEGVLRPQEYPHQDRYDADLRRAFLYIYFDGELYDGYMWFSSLLD